jgi:2,3-bisphosphoglycerate-independent phosphoglycerate mutase
MLTIQNIEYLKGKELNDWKVLDAGEDLRAQLGKNIYLLTFARIDRDGNVLDDRAGVIIDRNISQLMSGYQIRIVYEDWTYEIGTSYWAAVDIRNKDAFFGMVLNKINTEYYKRNLK